MSDYSALRSYLKATDLQQVELSFATIEDLIGPLPKSAYKYPAWWSNNPSNNPRTQAWLDASYRTSQLNLAVKKITFVKEANK